VSSLFPFMISEDWILREQSADPFASPSFFTTVPLLAQTLYTAPFV
jgi:hypothetical protein